MSRETVFLGSITALLLVYNSIGILSALLPFRKLIYI